MWGILSVYIIHDLAKTFAVLGVWVTTLRGFDRSVAKIFLSALYWTLWKTSNRACFEHVMPRDPCNAYFHMCYSIHPYLGGTSGGARGTSRGPGPPMIV
jgi:hypothetical protein